MKAIMKKLEGAAIASDKAVEQFITTEETLKQQNEVIAKTLDEAETEIRKLQALRESGLKKHSDNLGVISRIGQIVRGSDDGLHQS
jgi:hypothetical protein